MSDIFARVIADKLSKTWKQTVIVENKPGVSGMAYVAKAAPDGYTLLLVSNGYVIMNKINPDVPFDPVKDFDGVTRIATLPVLLVVPPGLPASDMKGFVSLAKSKPGSMSYASAGVGSTSDIAAELFLRTQDLNMVHVPYKGALDAYTSVIRNDTQAFFTPPGVGQDLIRSGKVKALGVSGPRRLPNFPDVPTFAEAGFAQADYEAWFGLLVPHGVPAAVLARLNEDVGAAMRLPDVTERFAQQGVTAAADTAPQFAAIIRSDAAKFGPMFEAKRR